MLFFISFLSNIFFTPGPGLQFSNSHSLRQDSFALRQAFLLRTPRYCLNKSRTKPSSNDAVLIRGHCDYAHLWMLAQQFVTDVRPRAWLIERNHHDIRQGLLYAFANLRLISDFTNNFYVRLIRKRREHTFPHEARMVSHQDAN